ncbi:MAG: hypothetical protein FD173_887 [Gallionellaceae bacterium]|nr:MAG: hypothetical protein FD173_887 [Gallionellaceae bacterium]
MKSYCFSHRRKIILRSLRNSSEYSEHLMKPISYNRNPLRLNFMDKFKTFWNQNLTPLYFKVEGASI